MPITLVVGKTDAFEQNYMAKFEEPAMGHSSLPLQ